MRKLILFAMAALLGAAYPLSGQSANQLSDRAQKTAEREQVLAELDDASPLARIGALEEILASSDNTLITFATKKVAAGSDKDLKALILRRMISNSNRQFIFQMSECRDFEPSHHDNRTCVDYLNRLSEHITILFSGIDQSTGTFTVISQQRRVQRNDDRVGGGKVIDDRLVFQANFTAEGGNSAFEQCLADLKLGATGEMAGMVRCKNLGFVGSFTLY